MTSKWLSTHWPLYKEKSHLFTWPSNRSKFDLIFLLLEKFVCSYITVLHSTFMSTVDTHDFAVSNYVLEKWNVRGSGTMQQVLYWGRNWKSKAVTTRDKLSWLAHFLVCFFLLNQFLIIAFWQSPREAFLKNAKCKNLHSTWCIVTILCDVPTCVLYIGGHERP